jgi:hypothetical protein
MNRVRIFIGFILLVFAIPAWAAESASERPDFSKLRNQRLQIISEIESLKAELLKVQDSVRKLNPLEDLQFSLKFYQDDLKNSQTALENQKKFTDTKPEVIAKLENDIKWRQSNVERVAGDIERKKNAETESDRINKLIKGKEKELQDIEVSISDVMARDIVAQDFKTKISLYFALIVGVMIVCFFGIAFYDQKVRITIYGQAGMQFVTLFSLIIAIILFGITGILADKELAALLGGISGYILGKYNQGINKSALTNMSQSDENNEKESS